MNTPHWLLPIALMVGLSGCGADTTARQNASQPTATTAELPAGAGTKPPARPWEIRSLDRLIGQKLMVSFRQRSVPPASLIDRIRHGEVGGIILFPENVAGLGASGVRTLVDRLQSAAAAGGSPPLLIATDQEGGAIRRMPGPPEHSAEQLGRQSRASVRRTGLATGRSLRRMGITVDLAPVVDVPATADSFLQERAFGNSVRSVTRASLGFARGLQDARVAATAKHFPGLGHTGSRNTDLSAVTITASRAALAPELSTFDAHVRAGTRLVMVSNATYSAYDAARPAVLSRNIVGGLRARGFTGVVISDELANPAVQAYGNAGPELASLAGVDVLLYANSDGRTSLADLRAAVRDGRMSRALVNQQVKRILALKSWLLGPEQKPPKPTR